MNIFKHTSSFIGDFNDETNTITVREVLLTAHKIRLQLGKKSYLLDTYLSLFFTSVNNTLAYDSADSGFQLGSELRRLCRTVVDKDDEYKDHPLYDKAVEALNSQKSIIEFQERYTQCNLLFLALVDDFFSKIVDDYIDEEKASLYCVLDRIRFQDLYNDISSVVGEDAMDNLNLLLKKKFMVSPILSTFIQGFTNDLLYNLLGEDIETNKKTFQIIFDDLFSIYEND